jgi:hypothetical protein
MLRAIERELLARRAVLAEHPVLDRLARRLEGHLDGLLVRPVYFADAKALLSRDGGVCPRDGARLLFHPERPHRHRCPRCGGEYEGERHHRAWVTRYHLWLSERAIHLALLGALRDRADLAARAGEILAGYAGRYRSYPNRDNVLGPSRLFFSTYLESIWLVQMTCAAMFLEATAAAQLPPAEWRRVRAMVEESAGLIAEFNEGGSNRQVWNAAAVIGAGAWLGRPALVDHGRRGPAGVVALLDGVDETGMWFEGENYHFFALRGFLFAGELLRWQGFDLYTATGLRRMFGAPLATLYPDLTLPARGDAPFGVSVRQPRFAELWELGRARSDDRRLDSILALLYAPDVPDGEDTGLIELAEQEQNRPAHRQYRDRLGWKALLWMRPTDPVGTGVRPESCLLETQGIGVVRPGPGRLVSVESGRRGGGHAHPDALHLSLFWEDHLLADFGTASYVGPSLHWYRAALAHNAPGQAAVGQHAGPASCDAFASDGTWHWMRARVEGLLGVGTAAARSVVAGPEFLLDMVSVIAPDETAVDLPLHPLDGLELPPGEPTVLAPTNGDAGHETGYDCATDVERVAAPYEPIPLSRGSGLELRLIPRSHEIVVAATAPGPPGIDFADGKPLRFVVRRAPGSGRWIQLFSPVGVAATVTEDGREVVVTVADRVTRFHETEDSLLIQGGVGPSTVLRARRPAGYPSRHSVPTPRPVTIPRASREPTFENWPDGGPAFELGAAQYRRSEAGYGERGPFRAIVRVAAFQDALWFRIDVVKAEVWVRPGAAADPALDNESPDIHSDGVQCYVGRERWAGFVVVPDFASGGVRARPVAGTAARDGDVDGWCRRTPDGYAVLVRWASGGPLVPGDRLRFTVTVNEMYDERERRAGQLALAGGGWVYLRGDREAPQTALVGEIA